PTKVKPRITKVIGRRGGEYGRQWLVRSLCLLATKHLPHPFGNALPSAQNDHFRYPSFHFRYPFKPLSKSLSLPASARATDESRRCRQLCDSKLRLASLVPGHRRRW